MQLQTPCLKFPSQIDLKDELATLFNIPSSNAVGGEGRGWRQWGGCGWRDGDERVWRWGRRAVSLRGRSSCQWEWGWIRQSLSALHHSGLHRQQPCLITVVSVCVWACILCVSIFHLPLTTLSLSSMCSEDQEALQAQKIWKKAIMLVWRAAANHRWASHSYLPQLLFYEEHWPVDGNVLYAFVIYCFVFQVCKCVSAACVWWYRPRLSQHCTQVSRWDSYFFEYVGLYDFRDAENLNLIL